MHYSWHPFVDFQIADEFKMHNVFNLAEIFLKRNSNQKLAVKAIDQCSKPEVIAACLPNIAFKLN